MLVNIPKMGLFVSTNVPTENTITTENANPAMKIVLEAVRVLIIRLDPMVVTHAKGQF